MKQTATKKKKKRPRGTKTQAANHSSRDASNQQDQRRGKEDNEEQKNKPLNLLMEAFGSISLEEVTSAYNQANGDIDKAAEFLSNFIDNDNESEDPEPSTSSMSSGASSSGSSGWGFAETGCLQDLDSGMGRCRGGKQKKRVVAATGTVSTVLGKEYVRPTPRGGSAAEAPARSVFVKEDAEQFLCSILGDKCELGMGVVRDVLCQCGYNVEKAFNALRDLSASPDEQSKNYNVNNRQDTGFLSQSADNLTDRASDCISNLSESELQDNIRSVGYGCRNYSEVLASSEALPSCLRSNMSDLPQEILDSLFKIPKKLQSLGPAIDVCPSSVAEPQQDIYANGDEYHEFRKTAKGHWDSMGSYYQKAATAYSKGQWGYAAYLSDQGKIQTKLAREADERASQNIFKARNKGFENLLRIDLHGQHVKEAMRLLKQRLLLLFGIHVPSVRTLRVITGCGTHGTGKSKVKQSVIKLLKKEGVQCHEENNGMLLVKLDGYREFSFLESESETE